MKDRTPEHRQLNVSGIRAKRFQCRWTARRILYKCITARHIQFMIDGHMLTSSVLA